MTDAVNLNKILREHKGPDGLSLFEHLSQILEKVVHDPTQASKFENFEQISSFIKRNAFANKQPKTDKDVNKNKDYSTQMTQWYNECLHLLEKTALDHSSGKKERVKSLGVIQNLVSDARLLETAGFGFGEEETVLLQKAIQKLAARYNAREMRFWGKIYGTKQDYFIIEGLLNHDHSDEPPTVDSEGPGFGCNRWTHWVANNVLDDWLQLPLVTPQQVIAARKIKHVFTGDLNAPVETYPPFPGKEKHYLKAQIVRITHNTTIGPKDIKKTNDDDPKKEDLEIVEESKYPAWEELADPGTWVHYNQNILEAGRVRHYVPANIKEEEREEYENQKAENDPTVDRLLSITEDKLSEKYTKDYEKFQLYKHFKNGEEDRPLWRIRTYGDKQLYTGLKEEGTLCYAAVVFKSLLWPGAVTVAGLNGYANLYLGYGHKFSLPSIDPLCLPPTQDDPDDVEDFPEPYPSTGKPKPPEPEKPEGGEEGAEGQNAEANEEDG